MAVTIYHNPGCGTSRNTLGLIRNAGIEPVIVEYLKTPPSRERLVELIAAMGLSPRDLLRRKGTPHDELGLDDPTLSDDQLVDAMLAHPILINRPIVVSDIGTKLCRPSDLVLELLPDGAASFTKEEGASVLRATVTEPDAAMIPALAAAGLPIEDLTEPGRSFLRFTLPNGDLVGYGGFEHYGADALLRSIVVLPAHRGQGLGRNMMLLLMRRAFDAGARRAYALTTTADSWLGQLGFEAVQRAAVPDTILQTRQARTLCPGSASIWSRTLQP